MKFKLELNVFLRSMIFKKIFKFFIISDKYSVDNIIAIQCFKFMLAEKQVCLLHSLNHKFNFKLGHVCQMEIVVNVYYIGEVRPNSPIKLYQPIITPIFVHLQPQ